MQKKYIITIAGKPGSGKSSAARAIAASLDYDHFSSGDLFRAIGRERGLDVLKTNHAAEAEDLHEQNVDYLVDQRLREIGETEDRKVIDSRMAWHWIPTSFKVYLDLDLLTAAKRILGEHDEKRHAHEAVHENPQEYADDLKRRLDSENRRYKKLYDVDTSDMNNYDLVIDTAANNLEQVTQLVLSEFDKWRRA